MLYRNWKFLIIKIQNYVGWVEERNPTLLDRIYLTAEATEDAEEEKRVR